MAVVFYHGGTSWAEEGVVPDFSDNSNPIGPPEGLIHHIREAVERGVYLRFPANLAEEALREYEGVEVTVFNGATEALLAVIAALKPRRVVIPWPNYADYVRVAQLLGVDYVLVEDPLQATSGDLVVMSNPNNPLGRYVERDEVLDLARRLKARGAALLVDESFIDFTRGESAAPDVPVVKSYGKLLAAPGLRVGAYLGDPPPGLKAPWRLNSIADYALYHLGASGIKRHRERTLAYMAEELPRVWQEVAKCARPLPTDVHFFVVRGREPRGVKVRPLWTHGLADAYRVSIKTPELNDVLIKAICSA